MASPAQSLSAPIAVIDMGSNSFHLLVTRWRHGALQPVTAEVERVQTALLMEGSCLTGPARERVLACLGRFRRLADRHGCERIVAVGTAAMRQASNADALLQAAGNVLGWPVAVLGGRDEARLIYQAVATHYAGTSRELLVLDIGGGSTEMILGRGESIEALESVALGCVSSLKQHFNNGRLDRGRFDACVRSAVDILQPLACRFPNGPDTRVMGCSGTAQAVAAVLGIDGVKRIHLDELRDRMLAQFSSTEQVTFPGLDHSRSSLLAPGLALLTALFEALSIETMEAADVALREGVAIAWFRGDSGLPVELPRRIAV